MKNLNELGVQEMDAKEIKELNGGNPWVVRAAIFVAGAFWGGKAAGAVESMEDAYWEACANGTYDGMPRYHM